MKLIPITGRRSHKIRVIIGYTKVDDDIYEKVSKYLWSRGGKNRQYAANSKLGLLHRYIMGYPKKLDIDHKNNDKLDNRRSNLRLCTRSQNMMNTKKRKNLSGYKNIYWDIKNKKWEVKLMSNGKKIRIGSFRTKKDAIVARNKSIKKYHGKFANYS